MSGASSTCLEGLVLDLESNIADVTAWAKAFEAVGTHATPLDPAVVYIMALGLERSAKELHELWREAYGLVSARRQVGGR